MRKCGWSCVSVALALALLLLPQGTARAETLDGYYNYLLADLAGVTEALGITNNLTTTSALQDALNTAAVYANLLITDATALEAAASADSVSGFKVSTAKQLVTAAKSLLSAINKAKLQTLLTSNGGKQFKDVQKPISSSKKFVVYMGKAFFPFSPAPWGLTITDDLTGSDAVGLMAPGGAVTVSINVPAGMTGFSYYITETEYGVLTNGSLIPPGAPIALAAGSTQVPLTFGQAGGGVALVVVDSTGHIIQTKEYYSRGPTTGGGGGGGTVVSTYDGVYNCTVTSWAPGMQTQTGPATFYVTGGFVYDSTSAFTGYVYQGGQFIGTENAGTGETLNMTGTFYSKTSVYITGGDASAGMTITVP